MKWRKSLALEFSLEAFWLVTWSTSSHWRTSHTYAKNASWFWGSGFFYLAFLYVSRSLNKVCLGWRSPSLLKHSPNRLNGIRRGCFTSRAKSFWTENFQNFPALVRSCESTKRTGTTQNNIMLPKEFLPDFIWIRRSCLLACSTLFKGRFLGWCKA